MTREEKFRALMPNDPDEFITSDVPGEEPAPIGRYAFVAYTPEGNWDGSGACAPDAGIEELKEFISVYWFDNCRIIDLDTDEVVFETKAKTTKQQNCKHIICKSTGKCANCDLQVEESFMEQHERTATS